MLSIRLQRVGRKGHALYRIIVQDSHRQPTSGKVVAQLGSYNPHSKEVILDNEKAQKFLDNGAQPTPRVISLFKREKIKLPKWVQDRDVKKQKTIRNPEKLRRNQPAEPEKPAEESAPEVESQEAPAETEAPVEAAAPTVEEAEKSVEQIAEKEVDEGQVTAEEEVADSANEDSDQNASEDIA